jgi:NADH-quinone oxidoreductase subunit J
MPKGLILMQTFLIIFCLALMVVVAAAVMLFRSLLKSTICLAITSVLLSIVLFLLSAYWAALFELSVCAGLITAVFVSTVSFSTVSRRDKAHAEDHRVRFKPLPYFMISIGLALLGFLVYSGFTVERSMPLPAAFVEFKQVFWNTRQADILAQIALLLAGSFAVIVLFKERDKE